MLGFKERCSEKSFLRSSEGQTQSWLSSSTLIHLFPPSLLPTMVIWEVNCYFYALESKAYTGNHFWGNSNRQKPSERMHRTPFCFKFFQMLARCPSPCITVDWSSVLHPRYQIICRNPLYHAALQQPPGNSSQQWISALLTMSPHQLLTPLSFITLSLLWAQLHENHEEFSNFVFPFVSSSLQKLLLLCSEEVHIRRNI